MNRLILKHSKRLNRFIMDAMCKDLAPMPLKKLVQLRKDLEAMLPQAKGAERFTGALLHICTLLVLQEKYGISPKAEIISCQSSTQEGK
jgi:hypothetical protein